MTQQHGWSLPFPDRDGAGSSTLFRAARFLPAQSLCALPVETAQLALPCGCTPSEAPVEDHQPRVTCPGMCSCHHTRGTSGMWDHTGRLVTGLGSIMETRKGITGMTYMGELTNSPIEWELLSENSRTWCTAAGRSMRSALWHSCSAFSMIDGLCLGFLFNMQIQKKCDRLLHSGPTSIHILTTAVMPS